MDKNERGTYRSKMKMGGDQYASVGRMTSEMLQKSCGSQVAKVFFHSWGKKVQERNECWA